MVLCDNAVESPRHLPGDSGSLEKALGPGPSSSRAQVHRRRPDRSCGPPQSSPVASTTYCLTLPAGGKAVVAAAEAVMEKAGEREVSAGRKE